MLLLHEHVCAVSRLACARIWRECMFSRQFWVGLATGAIAVACVALIVDQYLVDVLDRADVLRFSPIRVGSAASAGVVRGHPVRQHSQKQGVHAHCNYSTSLCTLSSWQACCCGCAAMVHHKQLKVHARHCNIRWYDHMHPLAVNASICCWHLLLIGCCSALVSFAAQARWQACANVCKHTPLRVRCRHCQLGVHHVSVPAAACRYGNACVCSSHCSICFFTLQV